MRWSSILLSALSVVINASPWVGFNPDTVPNYIWGNARQPADVDDPVVSAVSKTLHNQKRETAEMKLQNIINRLESARDTYFKVSPLFDGARYYLSPPSFFLIRKEADAVCRLIGGYLVEVDSAVEHDFIKAFLSQSPGYKYVLTGATDEALGGNWLNGYSNTPARYIKWGHGEPNGGTDENCLFFWQELGFDINDWACSSHRNTLEYAGGFLCEVPIPGI
ncbi:unnamed protein product [Lymnaea stagnalis]|uniref:C-type lectin domain-containing protein n=1 Tax=Lymnaea stagnalis TaxID=6523 RepID=A0AAV2H5W6_LYMST